MKYKLTKKQDPEKVGICSKCGERFHPKVAPKDRDFKYFQSYVKHMFDRHPDECADTDDKIAG